MRPTEPPSLATWMLEHGVPGGRDEALAGDLLEEFRSGRTGGWFWRQVLGSVAIGFSRELGHRSPLMLFAVMWSMFAPAWLLAFARLEEHAHLNDRFYRMDWPWSTVCDLGLLFLSNLAFIWVGIVLYLLPDSLNAGRKLRRLSRGVAASVPVLMVVWVALIVIPKYFIEVQTTDQHSLGPVKTYAITHLNPTEVVRLAPQEEWAAQYGDPIIAPEVSPFSLITDLQESSMLARLPFFLVVLCALWRVTPSARVNRKRVSE